MESSLSSGVDFQNWFDGYSHPRFIPGTALCATGCRTSTTTIGCTSLDPYAGIINVYPQPGWWWCTTLRIILTRSDGRRN